MKMASFWLTVSTCITAWLLQMLAGFSKSTYLASLLTIWVCLHLFRRRTWSQSSSRSLHQGLRLRRAATRGWHASPTDRTWTGQRWRSWSTKATLSHLFILPENRTNCLSSTSCSKVTDRSRQNRCLPKVYRSLDGAILLMLCHKRWCQRWCLLQRRCWTFWILTYLQANERFSSWAHTDQICVKTILLEYVMYINKYNTKKNVFVLLRFFPFGVN